MKDRLEIVELGALGDGVALTPSGPLHVPFALPGESVVPAQAGLPEIAVASPKRIEPICRHFGTCGGCQLQHLERQAYLDWKCGLLRTALERENISVTLEEPVAFGAGLRRRVVFTAIRAGGSILLGFTRKGSNRIVSIEECPVLIPEIVAQLGLLRELAKILASKKDVIKIAVLACDNGLDVSVNNGIKTTDAMRMQAITLVGASGLARLSLNGEVLIEPHRPILETGLSRVTPPPGAFAQAVKGAETRIADLVCNHLRQSKRVADLFSGHGTFGLRLAASAQVHCTEFDAPALESLGRAWRETGGRLKKLTWEKRDLFRRPMTAGELEAFDGAVFDPPRAGAEAQCRELAMSKVKRICAVSCNPKTLARDLAILMEGGFAIRSITPIDQFVFTPHLEAVALLER